MFFLCPYCKEWLWYIETKKHWQKAEWFLATRTRETQQIFLKFNWGTRILSNHNIIVIFLYTTWNSKLYIFTCEETFAQVTYSWFQGMTTRKCSFGENGQYDIKSRKSVSKKCKLTITLMVGWVPSIKYIEIDVNIVSYEILLENNFRREIK